MTFAVRKYYETPYGLREGFKGPIFSLTFILVQCVRFEIVLEFNC